MRLFTALLLIALSASPVLADSAAIPAAPKEWGAFIRGGLIAAGLYILAMIAGRLLIAWRQRKAKSSSN